MVAVIQNTSSTPLSLVCFDLQKFVFQSGWKSLPAQAKIDLLEKAICPDRDALEDCNIMKMNFAIDWGTLRVALLTAVQDMQPQQHMHELDRSNDE